MTKADSWTLLLPERRRFAGQRLSAEIAWRFGRADRLPPAQAGERAQLLRYFEINPAGFPIAALTRDADVGDAAAHMWLRADPVHVRPDMTGARLLAWSNLGLSAAEAAMFLEALAPLFAAEGLAISAGAPERWYLRLPPQTPMVAFASPAESLGDDLFQHLPTGSEGRRWRALLNEAQIGLHHHPRNAERMAAGQLPVNSLWFWGAGALPESVRSPATRVMSEDAELRALARSAGLNAAPAPSGSVLMDLRHARDWARLESGELRQAIATMEECDTTIALDFADGTRWRLRPSQHWRFWRKPLTKIDP